MKPAEDVLFGFVLNARQCVVQLHGDGTGRTVSIDRLFAVVGDGANG